MKNAMISDASPETMKELNSIKYLNIQMLFYEGVYVAKMRIS